MQKIQTLVNQIIAATNERNYKRVESLAKEYLKKRPNDPFGWKAIGNARQNLGKIYEALDAKIKVVNYAPNNASAHYDLGNAYMLIEDLDKAKECYEYAIGLKNDFAEAFCNLGEAHNRSGGYDLAVRFLKIALSHKKMPEAYNNLANALRKLGNLKESKINCEKAIESKENFCEAYLSYGNVLLDLDHKTEAVLAYQNAIKINPSYTEAYNNLGVAYLEFGDYKNAEINILKALSINVKFAEAYNNLGNLLKDMGSFDLAARAYKDAINLKRDTPAAHLNLANLMYEKNNFKEAIGSYKDAIKLNPHYAAAIGNLGVALQDGCFHNEAINAFSSAVSINPNSLEAYSNYLFSINYTQTVDKITAFKEAEHFGKLVSQAAVPKFTKWEFCGFNNKINIGFVSGDLRSHPVGYFLESFLGSIDKTKFSLHAFIANSKVDEMSRRLYSLFDNVVNVFSVNDIEAAKIVNGYKIDVLIDLSGHTAFNRLKLFSYKPAQIQISWLGYFATTGIPEIDYIIGDPYVLPSEESVYFTEKRLVLPFSYICFTPPSYSINIESPPVIKNGYLTFGSFNNISKINDQVIKLWSKILMAVPNSKLLLKSKQLGDSYISTNIRNKFMAYGVCSQRLITEGPSSRFELLNSYNRVDIALDPFPYPGGTTTLEAMWMGVPLIFLKGNSFLSNVGLSIACNVGTSNLVANDHDEYLDLAVKLGSDIKALVDYRSNLRTLLLNSPICQAKEFAMSFESLIDYVFNKSRTNVK